MERKWATLRLSITIFLAAALIFCMAASGLADSTAPSTSTLIVKMTAGLTPDQIAAFIANDGGTEISSVPALRLHIVQVSSDQLSAVLQNYQSDQNVESAEVNQTRKAEGIPSDTLYGDQWYLPKIGWDAAFGSLLPFSNATVAILDTGIDASHPDLGANVIPGTSILDGSDGRTDSNGHGTAMAGIVAAVTDNNTGIAGVGFSGVSLMPVTVLGADGNGQDADIISGIIYAADHGANVILMGFSNPGFSQNLQDAIDYAWSKGVVLVAPTGNDSISTPTYPAGDQGVMGVSSTDTSDQLSAFSNDGKDVFICAPGENIITTGLSSSYVTINGTSAAAAIVAGAAGFLKAYDQSVTNGTIDWQIASTADAAGASADETGNGRINLANAIAQTGSDTIEPAGAPNGGPYVGPYVIAATKLATVTGASISSQSGNLTYGTGGSVTYTVTVRRSSTDDGETSNLSFTPTPSWPAGVTTAWNPSNAKVTFSGTSATATVILSITTTNPTPASSTSFTVQATGANSSKGSASGTLTVGQAALTVTADNKSKTYGSANPNFTVSYSGFVNGDGSASLTAQPTATSTATASSTAGAYTITAAGGSSNNYALSYLNGTLTINRATPAIDWSNPSDITYGTALGAAQLNATATAIVAGTSVNVQGSFAYAPVSGTILNAGSNQTLSATFTPADTTDYNTATASVTINVLKAAPVITWSKPADIIYGTALTEAQLSATASAPGTFAYTPAGGTVLSAGSGQILSVIFTPTDTAIGTATATVALNVNPRPVTVTADTQTKAYGDNDPALSYKITSGTLIGTDTIAGALTRTSGENIGIYVIGQGSLALSANYSLSYDGASLTIIPRPITVTALSDSKSYDGTAGSKALPTITSGSLVSGDTANFSQTFDSKNAGQRTLTATGTLNDGNGGKNYSITFATAQGSITPLTITGGITANDKIYDGNNSAVIASRTLSDVISGDTVSLTGGTATFADKNVGTGKTVTATGLSLAGADAGNYTLSATPTTATASIAPKTLNITAAGVNKVYDGTTAAAVTLSDDRISGDVFSDGYSSASFIDKNAGIGKAVNVSGISISGTDAGNYTANTTVSTTASITPLSLTAEITVAGKLYDGNNSATIQSRTLTGVLNGDSVSLTGGTATFADKNAGTGKTVTATGLSLTGADVNNYMVNGTAKTTADISPRTLTVSAAGTDKIYDGTTVATVTLSDDRIAGDVFADSYGSANFIDKNVGTNKAVSVAGISIGGTDAGNYTVNTTASTAANITPKAASVTPTAAYKIYGDLDPSFTGTLTGFMPCDSITATYSRSAGENVGTYAIEDPLCPAGALSNYNITYYTANFTVNPRPISVKADAKTIFYGSPDPTLTFTVASGNLVAGDSFTGNLTRQAGENVGTYPIQQGTLALSANYSLTYAGADLTIIYNFGGFLDPVSLGWLNGKTFKQGSTIPVKFQIPCGNSPNGYCSTAIAKLSVAQFPTAGNYIGTTTVVETLSAVQGDSGVAFRYDSTGNQYIYNLSTKGMAPGYTYQLAVTLDDGRTPVCLIYLK